MWKFWKPELVSMASNQHTTRIIRNPITGEEIQYTKGQTPRVHEPNRAIANNFTTNNSTTNSKLNVNQIKQLVDNAMPLSIGQTAQTTKSSSQQVKKSESDKMSNLSRAANASSIPLLNFDDLYSDDRKETGAEFKKKLNEFVSNKSELLAPSFMQNKPMFHKTTYKMQTESSSQITETPIISYRNQLTKIPSHLDAPRDASSDSKDLKVIFNLNNCFFLEFS